MLNIVIKLNPESSSYEVNLPCSWDEYPKSKSSENARMAATKMLVRP